jgi:pseudouridine kinase
LVPEALEEAAAEHSTADAWFIDANLPPQSVAWLAARDPRMLAANAVSVPKARRLHSILDRLDFLVANKEEAAELAGSDGDAISVGLSLHAAGVDVVAVTIHEEGVVIVAAGEATALEALSADARDVTGAGDAFTATMLHGLLRGRDPVKAARVALGAAAITLEADASVAAELSEKTAAARAGLPSDA